MNRIRHFMFQQLTNSDRDDFKHIVYNMRKQIYIQYSDKKTRIKPATETI